MDQGFLVYVTQTYPAMVLYLKGFHLSIEMWQGGRDVNGYKLRETNYMSVDMLNSLSSLDGTKAQLLGGG